MKVVILGSGATAGTLPECPTASGFGETLSARRADWREVYSALARAVADSQEGQPIAADRWDLSTVWTRVDYYSKLREALGTSDYGANASYDLHRAVLEVYGIAALVELEKLLPSNRPFTLLKVIEELRPGDMLASFNWDVVAESIAERRGLFLIQAPHPSPSKAVQLVKPHGSVSWPHLLDRGYVDFQLPGGRPRTTPMLPTDVQGAKEPFLLGAVPIKSELIREVQEAGRTNAYDVVRGQWLAIVEAVRNADEIAVVGYSFPQEDQYGRFLLREAIRQRRQDAGPISLQYYELAERMAEVGKAILETFGEKNIQIQWRGPVESPVQP